LNLNQINLSKAMNIFLFQIFFILDIVLFIFGLAMPIIFRERYFMEAFDKVMKVMLILYASSFVSFIMFQTNPLYIFGTGYDLVISFVSGYIIAKNLVELLGQY